jgi:hypothetical protein
MTEKASVNIPAKDSQEARQKARAAQVILENASKDNLEFLAELSQYKNVNWKLWMGKNQIREKLG